MLWIVAEIPRILGKQNDRLPFSGTLGQWNSKESSLVMQSGDWTGRLARVFMAWDREGKEALASLCRVCLPARKCEMSSVFYRTGLALEALQRSKVKGTKYVWSWRTCHPLQGNSSEHFMPLWKSALLGLFDLTLLDNHWHCLLNILYSYNLIFLSENSWWENWCA